MEANNNLPSLTNRQTFAVSVENIVTRQPSTIGLCLNKLQKLRFPPMSFTAMGLGFVLTTFFSPRTCSQLFIFPAFRLFCGVLYPAYASYKAVRTKSVKEYVKWMMYWIVFAFFTFAETLTDVFLSWFPFYYEIKVLLVIWLLSPVTKGSSVLYKKFVHPMLIRHEDDIEEYLNQAKEKGYSAVLQLGSKGVNYATNVIMQTAIKGGGNLVQTIKRSYSLSDLSEPNIDRTKDEIDNIVPKQDIFLRQKNQVLRSSSGSRHTTGMYFSEVDVNSKCPSEFSFNIRSSEDISSGYSSAEPIQSGLSRTSSMTNSTRTRLKARRTDSRSVTEVKAIIENEFNSKLLPNSNEALLDLFGTDFNSKKEMCLLDLNDLNDAILTDNNEVTKNVFEGYNVHSNFPDEEIKYKFPLFIQWLTASESLMKENEMLRKTLENKYISIESNENSEDYFDASEEINELKNEQPTIENGKESTNNELNNVKTLKGTKKNLKKLSDNSLNNDSEIKFVNRTDGNQKEHFSVIYNNDKIFNNVVVLDSGDEIDIGVQPVIKANTGIKRNKSQPRVTNHTKGKAPEPPILELAAEFEKKLKSSTDVEVKSKSLTLTIKPKTGIFQSLPSMFRSNVKLESQTNLSDRDVKLILPKETEI